MADINAIFDEILLTEERIHEQGYDEGYKKGKDVGAADGFILGVKKGAEIGAEIGFYIGCVDAWIQLEKTKKIVIKSRANKVLEALENLSRSFPNENMTSQDILNKLGEIRAKFKQMTSLLELSQNHFSDKSF